MAAEATPEYSELPLVFSDLEYENALYSRYYRGVDDIPDYFSHLVTLTAYRVAVTRHNFYKLDAVVASLFKLKQGDAASIPALPSFVVAPLATIAQRFHAFLNELRAHCAAYPFRLELFIADAELIEYLQHIERESLLRDNKEILIAMGVVSEGVFTGPWRILLDPTTWCNIDCVYCRTFSPTKNPEQKPHNPITKNLDFSALKDYLTSLKELDVRRVSIVGGAEPTTVPYFSELVAELGQRKLVTNLTTNGTLLNQRRAKALVDADCFESIHVSVSAATQATYTAVHPKSANQWPPLLENMRFLARYKRETGKTWPRLIFLFVIHRENAHEIEAAVELAHELGFDSLWFQMLHVDDWNKFLVLHPEQYAALKEQLARAKERCLALGMQWDNYIDPQAEDLREKDGTWSSFMYKHGCMVGWYFSYLSFQKEIMFCCGVKEVGRLDADPGSFKALWNSPKYRYYRHNAKYLNNKTNIRSDNGRLLSNDFCRCCDNHNLNAEVLRFLDESGLQRFLEKDLRQVFIGAPPIAIQSISILNGNPTSQGVLIQRGEPLYVRVAYTAQRRSLGCCVQLSLAISHPSHPEERALAEDFIPVDLMTVPLQQQMEFIVRIDKFAPSGSLPITLCAKVAENAGSASRYYERTEQRLSLLTLERLDLSPCVFPALAKVSIEKQKRDSIATGERGGHSWVRLLGFVAHAEGKNTKSIAKEGSAVVLSFDFEASGLVQQPYAHISFNYQETLGDFPYAVCASQASPTRNDGYFGSFQVVVDFPSLSLVPGDYIIEIDIAPQLGADLMHRSRHKLQVLPANNIKRTPRGGSLSIVEGITFTKIAEENTKAAAKVRQLLHPNV